MTKWEPGIVGYGHSPDPPPLTPNTYSDMTLKSISAGYDIWNGVWPSFCADSTVYIYGNTDYNVQFMDSRDPMLPGYATDDEQWDKVNYLLNYWHNAAPGAHWKTLQAAIWYFTDLNPGGNFNSYKNHNLADYTAIVTYVEANGAGFNPGTNQWLAVVCIIDAGTQLSFIVVDP